MPDTNLSTSQTGLTRPNRTTLIAFMILVILGGGNVLAVRFSNFDLPPFWGAAARLTFTALIFWIILIARRMKLPSGRALSGTLIYGFIAFGASFALLYWGLLRIEAVYGVIVLALVPLLTIFFALLHGQEQFRWRALAGALLALVGMIISVGRGLGSTIPITSLLALIGGAACLAEAAVIFKLFPKTDPVATNAIGATVGAIFLLFLSLAAQETWQLPSSTQTWGVFAYLVIVGSVGVFYLYLYILSRWTASATSYAFLLAPIVTVILAALLTDEVVNSQFLVGSAIVLIGVWFGALRQKGTNKVPAGSPSVELT